MYLRKTMCVLGFSALALTAKTSFADVTSRVWLDQGWSERDAQTWYTLSQGSRLIPESWITHLPSGQGDYAFSERPFFQKFGFPYFDTTAPWPIGFVMDQDENGQSHLGLNCAACHTSQLKYQETEILAHGGQNFGDLRQLIEELTLAVKTTLMDDISFQRFQSKVGHDPDRLKAEMRRWLEERHAIDRTLDGTQDWLPGSADAVSYIFAATTKGVSPDLNFSVNPGNAPVNFPPAWNANQQARLQHSGLVSNGINYSILGNAKDGALVRNISEAYGVFADLSVDTSGKVRSSVNLGNLIDIENALSHLGSPTWPQDILGPLDPIMISQGKPLFDANCASCHGSIASDDILTQMPLKETLADDVGEAFVYVQPVVDQSMTTQSKEFGIPENPMLIGTDPMMVCNFLMHRSSTGNLNGLMKKNAMYSMAFFDRFGPEEMTTDIMAGLLIREVSQNLPTLIASQLENEAQELGRLLSGWFFENPNDTLVSLYSYSANATIDPLDRVRATCADFAVAMNRIDPTYYPMPGYKARPLNGIWSTPPFLHNGSVPTLWHLLQPTEKRPTEFYVGSAEYDPSLVGLANIEGPKGQKFTVTQPNGNLILGNWNGGHEYGTSLTDTEKMAIIEYVKSQ